MPGGSGIPRPPRITESVLALATAYLGPDIPRRISRAQRAAATAR